MTRYVHYVNKLATDTENKKIIKYVASVLNLLVNLCLDRDRDFIGKI